MHGTSYPLQLAIINSVAAYCDPEPSHAKENEQRLNDAEREIEKARGPNSPQTEDILRRLKRFHRAWEKIT